MEVVKSKLNYAKIDYICIFCRTHNVYRRICTQCLYHFAIFIHNMFKLGNKVTPEFLQMVLEHAIRNSEPVSMTVVPFLYRSINGTGSWPGFYVGNYGWYKPSLCEVLDDNFDPQDPDIKLNDTKDMTFKNVPEVIFRE